MDKDRRPGRFLLTASANVMTLPRLSESLAGRMEILALFLFSAGELAGVTETFLPRLFAGTVAELKPARARKDIAARLARGGYPEATQRAAVGEILGPLRFDQTQASAVVEN